MAAIAHTLIDSFFIRFPSQHGVDEDVHINCPPGNTTEGAIFTAVVTFDPPDTTITECFLLSRTGHGKIPGTPVNPPPNPNECDFMFGGGGMPVPRDSYDIHATGDKTGDVSNTEITVDPRMADPCAPLTVRKSKDQSCTVRLKGLTFKGAPHLDHNGNPIPLTLTGTVPVSFTLGGFVHSPGHKFEVALARENDTALTPFEGNNSPMEIQGSRWSRSFNNVSEGTYILSGGTDPNPMHRLQIVVKAHGTPLKM